MTQRLDDATVAEIVEMYQKGIPAKDISAELGCSPQSVWYYLRRAGARNMSGPPKLVEKWTAEQLEALVKDYQDGMPTQDLMTKWSVKDHNMLYRLFGELGVEARSRNVEVMNAKKSAMDHAVELYKQGLPIWAILEETGVDQPTMHRELHKRGVPNRREQYMNKWVNPKDPD